MTTGRINQVAFFDILLIRMCIGKRAFALLNHDIFSEPKIKSLGKSLKSLPNKLN